MMRKDSKNQKKTSNSTESLFGLHKAHLRIYLVASSNVSAKVNNLLLAGPEFLRHELNNRFLQSQAADRVPPGMSPSQLMHYESHQHHHQHLHQHQHQHQHFHSNGAPVATPQVSQSGLNPAVRVE